MHTRDKGAEHIYTRYKQFLSVYIYYLYKYIYSLSIYYVFIHIHTRRGIEQNPVQHVICEYRSGDCSLYKKLFST